MEVIYENENKKQGETVPISAIPKGAVFSGQIQLVEYSRPIPDNESVFLRICGGILDLDNVVATQSAEAQLWIVCNYKRLDAELVIKGEL